MKEIYLENAKRIALYMLDMEYDEVDEFNDLFIIHPFFNCIYLADKEGLFSIKNSPERFEKLKDTMRSRISQSNSIEDIMALILKPSKISFLYLLSENGFPSNTCGNLLGGVWPLLENNDTQEQRIKNAMRKWLLAADKSSLMSSEDMKLFNNLPAEVEIYRGSQLNEPAAGFSWSLSRDVAEWFATRFNSNNPIVYKTHISKKNIIAYIGIANEQEVIVDFDKLGDIETIDL